MEIKEITFTFFIKLVKGPQKVPPPVYSFNGVISSSARVCTLISFIVFPYFMGRLRLKIVALPGSFF